MKNLELLSNQNLIERFAEIAKARGKATMDLDTRRANVLFDKMEILNQVFRSRGNAARLSMVSLLDNSDRFVQYYAAISLLGLVPDKSQAVLEWNAKYYPDILGFDARGLLRGFREGTFKPE